MDGGMAVGAATIKVLDGAERLRLRRVTAGIVAAIANARHARLQQLRVAGAMRFMTVRAVLHHRGMLPDEGTAAFRVAAETVFVCGALDELLGIGGAVGIVATGAGYFALAVRHVRRALQLGAPHLMALQAYLGL